ncbi:uncharacterized protein VTP21DRAFT_7431 [Calcarisporiella thermophila]|uniref:uncharacterized protein n=1 Tax=Calcarisporiella thermophila TaxID=911321 RepID=UPI003743F0D0
MNMTGNMPMVAMSSSLRSTHDKSQNMLTASFPPYPTPSDMSELDAAGEDYKFNHGQLGGSGFLVIPATPSEMPATPLLNDSEQQWFSEFLDQVDVDQDFVFNFSLPHLGLMQPPPAPPTLHSPPPPLPPSYTSIAHAKGTNFYQQPSHPFTPCSEAGKHQERSHSPTATSSALPSPDSRSNAAVPLSLKRRLPSEEQKDHTNTKSPSDEDPEKLPGAHSPSPPTKKPCTSSQSPTPSPRIPSSTHPDPSQSPNSVKSNRRYRELLTEEEKRANHIASEQKRRNQIRAGFRDLTEIVPSLQNVNSSKSTILFTAVEFIRRLERRNAVLRGKVEQLEGRINLGRERGWGHLLTLSNHSNDPQRLPSRPFGPMESLERERRLPRETS